MTEDQAKQRFLLLMLMRTGGLILALIGLLLMRGGVLISEPMPLVGAALLLFGLLDSFLAPRFLKMFWDKQDK